MNDSERKACATCGTEIARSELVWTSKGELCSGCAEKAEAPSPLNLPPWPVLLALVFGAAPFFAEAATTSSMTVNGGVVSYHSYDFVAIPAGAVGLVLGIWALYIEAGRRLAAARASPHPTSLRRAKPASLAPFRHAAESLRRATILGSSRSGAS